MSVEYYYMNDLNTLYNASVGDKTDGGEHHMKMMVAHDNLEAYMQKMEHWRDTALQLSRNNGEAQAKINALEADYIISNRELLVKQVEIQRLTARIAELEAEVAELKPYRDGYDPENEFPPEGEWVWLRDCDDNIEPVQYDRKMEWYWNYEGCWMPDNGDIRRWYPIGKLPEVQE